MSVIAIRRGRDRRDREITTANPAKTFRLIGSLLMIVLAFLLLAVGCGGEEPDTADLPSLADLRGKTIGVASLADTFTLETRFVLQEAYGLDVSPEGGDVTFMESPAESLPTLLRNGDIDAAVMLPLGTFQALEDEDFSVLGHITEEMRALTGAPIINSLLVTYPDVVEQKADALNELNRMLAESVTYFEANQDAVLDAVAEEQDVDPQFLRWWWERQDLPLGDLSTDTQKQILDVWNAAMAVGDIESYPDLADVLFMPSDEESATPTDGERVTISLAVLDDPSRRAALYAIEQGIVTSDTVDLALTYLPLTTITQAASAKQYDALETTPLAVPLGATGDLDFVILSAALRDLDGTLLFVRSESAAD